MEEKGGDNSIRINVRKFFPNYQTKIFFTLFIISLVLSCISVLKINIGISILNQFLSIFSATLLLALTISLSMSTICAYFGKFKWMFIPLILWLLFATFTIRTYNITGLKDITTGDWTLAPDLDPYLYLRLAEDINNGALKNPDIMRYVPLGAPNYAYQSLMPWFIFYLYKIINIFGNYSLTYAAIIIPAILFAISAIGFLLFTKVLTSSKFSNEKSWTCAIITTLFYIFMPAMLHRTVAGVPEIESLGMAWFWFAFLFFTMAWKEQVKKRMIIYGILAGIFTGLMSWSWGGYRYIYMIIGLFSLLIFFFQKANIKNKIIFSSWLIPSLLIMFLQVKNLKSLILGISDTGFGIFVLFILIVDFILFDTKLKEKIKLEKINLPKPLVTLIIGIILLIFDSTFLINSLKDIFEKLLYPFGRERVGLTVAENKIPYFLEILGNFGYLLWIFIAGIIVIFYNAVKRFNSKNKKILNGFFILFILGFVFSKYSPTSILNGENFLSKFFYLGTLLIFVLILLYIISKAHIKKDEKTIQDFKEIDFEYILLLAFTFWGIVSMRGAVRLLFIISPFVPLISSFLFMQILNYRNENKNDSSKKIIGTLIFSALVIIMILTFINYSNSIIYESKGTVPGIYEQQWQKTMSWVRDNTTSDSVFVHWWDYGYWVQTIGQRPTVTDGGHFIGYWDHLIGRYVLTTPYPETALSFMKTHNVSYLLIDSTDLGKYGAYSIIGSDNNGNDRLSQIPVMALDSSQSRETNLSSLRVYRGGFFVDEDIIYGENENQIFLPRNNAILAAVILEVQKNESKISQPQGIFIYNQKQIGMPIRYEYNEGKLLDFGGGLDAVVRIIPKVRQNEDGTLNIDKIGTVLYLSPKVSKGLFSRLYLLNDPMNEYNTIKLTYVQQDPFVENLNSQGANLGEFMDFNGFRGPIKIWKVDYPANILTKEEFLRTSGNWAEFDNLTFTK